MTAGATSAAGCRDRVRELVDLVVAGLVSGEIASTRVMAGSRSRRRASARCGGGGGGGGAGQGEVRALVADAVCVASDPCRAGLVRDDDLMLASWSVRAEQLRGAARASCLELCCDGRGRLPVGQHDLRAGAAG